MARGGSGARISALDKLLLLALIPLAAMLAWTGGIFDDDIARTVRTSAVYVEPGSEVDAQRATEIVGDRRLILVYLATELGDRGGPICDDLDGKVEGNLVVIVGSDLRAYGCALIPGRADENLSQAIVAETTIAQGIRLLENSPTDSAKVMAAAYDRLVRIGNLPSDARVLRAPAASYVVAAVLIGTVATAAVGVRLGGRRLAAVVDDDAARRRRRAGVFVRRDAALSALGVRILDVEAAYADRVPGRGAADRLLTRRYETVLHDYLQLCRDCEGDSDDTTVARQSKQIRELGERVDDIEDRLTRPLR